MKPSIRRDSSSSSSEDDDDHATRDLKGSERDGTCTSGTLCVGMRVERELDGMWFLARIVNKSDDGLFEIVYEDEQNREVDIEAHELRCFDETRNSPQRRPSTPSLTEQQREMIMKDSLLLQPTDYDPNKTPTVVLHHKGESHAASGYIINGLENNIAAGNGLRGIRWLRVNSF